MNPPKPRLSWEDVTSLEFISDIMILWGHDDVCEKPWVKPLLCKAAQAWHKLQQACEEIDTVKLEACWVWTLMENEGGYISTTSQYHLNVNVHLHSKLTQLDKLAHFLTGDGEGMTSGPPASPDTYGSCHIHLLPPPPTIPGCLCSTIPNLGAPKSHNPL
ncbi:uncharacterized protein EI90DRAFT_3135892 [Cantharellus anzutake]|uniref:uncharacterized protein n=1 Tax=Cantharellus anzutake TaxID=1750568 RepID=UPI001908870C|nr:uncharacterized protein EI90DRAFT_3135892 [Cantharellus anzutake]KAF8314563.1 hypothetical protein EI90DRAFT_3135892 [Cantharellus anzutake]